MPLFYGVGKAPGFTVAKVTAGTLGPRDVLPVARAYARRRAIDVLRARARRPQVVRFDGDEVEPVRQQDVVDTIISVIMDPTHRMHGALRRSLWDTIETKARPSDRRIFEALVAGARKGLNDASVARELGLSRAAVSQAKKRIGIIVRDAIAQNPKLIEPVLRQHELGQLGLARRGRHRSNTSPAVEMSSFNISAMAWRRLSFGRFNPINANARRSSAASSSVLAHTLAWSLSRATSGTCVEARVKSGPDLAVAA